MVQKAAARVLNLNNFKTYFGVFRIFECPRCQTKRGQFTATYSREQINPLIEKFVFIPEKEYHSRTGYTYRVPVNGDFFYIPGYLDDIRGRFIPVSTLTIVPEEFEQEIEALGYTAIYRFHDLHPRKNVKYKYSVLAKIDPNEKIFPCELVTTLNELTTITRQCRKCFIGMLREKSAILFKNYLFIRTMDVADQEFWVNRHSIPFRSIQTWDDFEPRTDLEKIYIEETNDDYYVIRDVQCTDDVL